MCRRMCCGSLPAEWGVHELLIVEVSGKGIKRGRNELFRAVINAYLQLSFIYTEKWYYLI